MCTCVHVCVHACSMGFWGLNLELSHRYSPPELALSTASSTPPWFSFYLHFLRHDLIICKTDLEFALVCWVAGITSLWHQPCWLMNSWWCVRKTFFHNYWNVTLYSNANPRAPVVLIQRRVGCDSQPRRDRKLCNLTQSILFPQQYLVALTVRGVLGVR